MKHGITLLAFVLIGGCANFSDRGTGEGGSEIGKNGYTVRCDASPPNQPGCYSPPPPLSWGFPNNFKFKLGAN
ncbi:hypothetical protein [Pseudomonas sp. LP_7_YM]|uniref:hypothetical protein n=1 Tax=Pseudomonas sp. LP_7_YM TaxID=2485137 RepID=UPI00105CBA06|nr:hypothetical protein [Pseudomonas sp. LP_7_YM]TDV72857.1 hypothetical protein EC915_1011005 [Pseudomonas sp. LP_7_YM]